MFSKLLLKLLKCFLKTLYTSFDIRQIPSVEWAWVGRQGPKTGEAGSEQEFRPGCKDRPGGRPRPGVGGWGAVPVREGDLQGRQEEAVLSCKIIPSESHLCLVLV